MDKKGKIDIQKVKKILILNMLPTTIGDTIFLTPLPRILKNRFPKKKISVTASAFTRNLLENNPYIDEVITIPELEKIASSKLTKVAKAKLYYKIINNLIKEIKQKNFDLCIVAWPNFSIMQILPKLSGINYAVGYSYKGSIFSGLLTETTEFKNQFRYPERHFLESYLDLLRLLGIEIKESEKYVDIFISKKDEEEARKIFKKYNLSKKDIVVAYQAGAKWDSKQWPRANFGELAKYLIKKYNAKVILTGSPDEFEMNEEINKIAKNKLINLCGKVSLGLLPALLEKVDLAIGNDSGIMHIAGAVGAKTIVIYGSTNPKHSRVLGKNKSVAVFKNNFCKPCITDMKNCKHNYNCMKVVEVKDVVKEVDSALKKTAK
jgi:lipopolysaccharide heptosyltransferase II